ncbi:murein L,D-transpeptidase [Lichenihabitans sp. Uapishka_5]|uniref:murein L,D-transpeptidase family protein n=1 Tax=Lichenihabitans sp. Uapishka_5 TaxID=3037302 RepID=UPI0029E7CC9B|nr:murein L,D-transpeptidase family protein [Lichenihabitans sp. Uapishka_5]MDX7952036.1 murein L,D-transpeptidase [Lichenihabitans sp. Uapishka_5]
MATLGQAWGARLVALAMLGLLAGCAAEIEPEKTGTVYPETLALMQSMNMERGAPIFVRIIKQDSRLEVWKQDRTGAFRLLKSYAICHFSGALGPKKAEGDHQAPEGFYWIGRNQMNPHSREYLSFNLGYPNAYDRSYGRTGDSLMVHGGCRSVGCYAMTNEQMEEIFGLAHEAFAGGQDRFQVQALPFRMTADALDQHRADVNAPFWQNLKQGTDYFDRSAQPPEVQVCNGRYVFDAQTALTSMGAGGNCTRL